MDQNGVVYRIRREVYEQFEPFKRKIIDIAVEEGLWEIIEPDMDK